MAAHPASRPRFRTSTTSSSYSKVKSRLARKAELARASRRRKKAYVGGLHDTIEALERQVEALKKANRLGVRWEEKDGVEEAEADGARPKPMQMSSDSDDVSEDEEATSDERASETSSPRPSCAVGCSATSSTSSSSSSASRKDRRRRRSRSSKRERRSRALRHRSSSEDSDASDDDSRRHSKRRRARETAGRTTDPSPAPSAPPSVPPTPCAHVSPPLLSVISVSPAPCPSPVCTLWLESVDHVQSRPVLSRSLVSLPPKTTLAALRAHLASVKYWSAAPPFAFMLGSRVLEEQEEAMTVSALGVEQGSVLRLVRRSLLLTAARVSGEDKVGLIRLERKEVEAATAISSLSQR